MSPFELNLDAFLNVMIPDSKLKADLQRILDENPPGTIELDSGTICVSQDCKFEIVSKSCVSQRFDRGFGSCFTALIAVGGVASLQYGVIEAHHCFAVLWYSADGEYITVDFSKNSP